MKKVLVAGLTVALLALAAPTAAHADGATFKGGCSAEVTDDGTPGGQLGGEDVWSGDVRVAVVPTTNGVPNGAQVSAECEVRVNGVSRGVVLSASGTGIAVNAGLIQFSASVTDVVALCVHVTSPAGTDVVCADITQLHGDLLCALLRTFGGTSIPPLYIDWDGDVWFSGFRFINCPPY